MVASQMIPSRKPYVSAYGRKPGSIYPWGAIDAMGFAALNPSYALIYPVAGVNYNLAWAKTYLKKVGAIDNSRRGVWSITKDGENLTEAEVQLVPARVRKQIAEEQLSGTSLYEERQAIDFARFDRRSGGVLLGTFGVDAEQIEGLVLDRGRPRIGGDLIGVGHPGDDLVAGQRCEIGE
jgi:hypothetical protein